tara:strand:- start:105 stop:311 length:207 start_codon:yes stop_codon:yes gene_type:complete
LTSHLIDFRQALFAEIFQYRGPEKAVEQQRYIKSTMPIMGGNATALSTLSKREALNILLNSGELDKIL